MAKVTKAFKIYCHLCKASVGETEDEENYYTIKDYTLCEECRVESFSDLSEAEQLEQNRSAFQSDCIDNIRREE